MDSVQGRRTQFVLRITKESKGGYHVKSTEIHVLFSKVRAYKRCAPAFRARGIEHAFGHIHTIRFACHRLNARRNAPGTTSKVQATGLTCGEKLRDDP